MLRSLLIRAKSSQDVTTWNASDTFYFISWRVNFHGKAFPEEAKMKSMPQLKRRKLPHLWRNYAKINLESSWNSWSTAGLSSLKKNLTTRLALASLKVAWNATTTIHRYSTTLGSRTDSQKTKMYWRSNWWTSLTRNQRRRMTGKKSNKRSKISEHHLNFLSRIKHSKGNLMEFSVAEPIVTAVWIE